MTRSGDDPSAAAGPRAARADDRFDLAATAQVRLGVRTVDGVEAVTRLPVRIYRFEGPPRGTLARLEAAALPGILAVEGEAGEDTCMVVVLPREYAPLAEPGEARGDGHGEVGPHGAALAADALRAAHAAGSVHGDLGPHRLWVAGRDDLLLEGVGVPWTPAHGPPDGRADVRALAATLLAFGPSLPPRLRNVLRTVANREPGAPATAADLARALDAYRTRSAVPPAEADPPAPAARVAPGPPPRSPHGPGPLRVVKDLPPGAVYHVGRAHEDDPYDEHVASPIDPGTSRAVRADRGARPRMPWTLLALLGIAGGVAVASLLGQDAPDPVPGGVAGGHVVRVTLDPPSSPPLEITVVASPPGSDLAPGTGLGRAPRRIVLDRDGLWAIRGSFGTRRSDDVAFHLPGEDAVVLSLPPENP